MSGEGETMKTQFGMAVTVVMALTIGSASAQTMETTSKRFFLEKNGGGIEVRVNDPRDARARGAHNGSASTSSSCSGTGMATKLLLDCTLSGDGAE